MDSRNILKGKRILIVDDEPDVLESLIEFLNICKIDTASSFEESEQLLENQYYDVAILYIMGVNGFYLLEIAREQKIPALMLTAHALSEEVLKKSVENGAAYFAPKDKMEEIDFFLADVLTALKMKKSPWKRWLNRLGGFYDTKFHGTDWREKEKKFWDEMTKYY